MKKSPTWKYFDALSPFEVTRENLAAVIVRDVLAGAKLTPMGVGPALTEQFRIDTDIELATGRVKKLMQLKFPNAKNTRGRTGRTKRSVGRH